MQVYKTSVWKQMTNTLWYLIGAGFLCYLIYIFTANALYYIGIPLIVAGYAVYSTLFSDKIRFELTDDNRLLVIRRRKVHHDFNCDEIDVDFKFVTGAHDEFWLYITERKSSERHLFDCELLGEKSFRQLLMDLGAYDPDRPVKVRTTEE